MKKENTKLNSKLILGIDPGYDRLGICVLEKVSHSENRLLFSACPESNRKKELNDRIYTLCGDLKKIIFKYKFEENNEREIELAIEKLFFTSNQKTVMGVSEARGAIIYLCQSLGLKIFEYTPLQIKIALTGYGKADKDQVEFMVKNILKITNDKKILDDEYDAIACALTHSASVK